MQSPSMALLRAFSPFWRSQTKRCAVSACSVQQQQGANFSSTQQRRKRNKNAPKTDMRITNIRYHLFHPLTPRPLRWSRTRSLRHWTIHRAWQLYQFKLRMKRQGELEKQYNSMYNACEALRLIDNHGLTAEDRADMGEPPSEGKEMGRLYRIAMLKTGVWNGPPIEYARIQTDTPPRNGWNHEWTR